MVYRERPGQHGVVGRLEWRDSGFGRRTGKTGVHADKRSIETSIQLWKRRRIHQRRSMIANGRWATRVIDVHWRPACSQEQPTENTLLSN